MRIRTFFALRLTDSVAKQLADQADGLCEHDRKLEVEWIDSSNYHLTLCFLGDTRLDDVEKLEKLIKARLQKLKSFQVRIKKVDYYEISPDISLLAALPAKSDELARLQKIVACAVEDADMAGFGKHRYTDFKPHITLGRLPVKNKFKHPKKWPKLDLYSLADAVVLFQSKKGEHGSVYTPLFEIELKDTA